MKKKQTNSEIHFKRTLYLGLPQRLSGKESACSAGVTGDTCSIPGSGNPLEEGVATHSSIPAYRIPWTEEPCGLQSTGSQESDMTKKHSEIHFGRKKQNSEIHLKRTLHIEEQEQLCVSLYTGYFRK